jgi:secreted Zn-dependent insulinase-like peptidase
MDSLYQKYFSEIISKKYLFDRKGMLLDQIEKVSKESLLKFTKDYILENPNKCTFSLAGN